MALKNIRNTLNFIVRHPLSKGRVLASLGRYARWQVGSRLVSGPVATEFVNGSMLLAKPGMTGATGNVFVGLHEFEDMAFVLHFLRPGDLFVDIGANIGSYTILAGTIAKANCIAFEPNPQTFVWLRRNIDLNGLANRVEAHCVALGSGGGEARFTVDRDCGNHLVLDEQQGSEQVQSVPLFTLDNAMKDLHPSILKIDVEGFETEVIKGGQATLSSPELRCIIIELCSLGKKYGFDEQTLREEIKSLGFSEYSYRPFERRLLERSKTSGSANTIFIRDHSFVQKRLKDSKPFTSLNSEI